MLYCPYGAWMFRMLKDNRTQQDHGKNTEASDMATYDFVVTIKKSNPIILKISNKIFAMYGRTKKDKLYPNIWRQIISHMSEVDRFPIKCLNKSFYKLNRSMCVNDTQESLAKHGLVESIIAQSYFNYFAILRGACEGAQRKLISIAIRYFRLTWYPGAFVNFDYGLEGACRGGHLNIIEEMIQQGAINWDKGFIGACRGEHLSIMDDMITRGVTELGLERAIENLCQEDKLRAFAHLVTIFPHIVKWSDYHTLARKYEAHKILELYKTNNFD